MTQGYRLAKKKRTMTEFAFYNFHFSPDKELQPLLDEADELIKIVAKSVITAKGERK